MTNELVREALDAFREERFSRTAIDELPVSGLGAYDIRVVAGLRSVVSKLGAMYGDAADRDLEIQPGRALQRPASCNVIS